MKKLGVVMTEEQEEQIRTFELRLHRLIYLCDEMKKRCDKLSQSLDAEKLKNETLQAQLDKLNEDYSSLKTAAAISLGSSDVRESRKRLTSIVREIDKCIALMND